MAYATYGEFNIRYATRLQETELTSHYLPAASHRLEGMLAPWFSLPFSTNNLTAQDLTIDLAYLMILQRTKEPKDYQALADAFSARVQAIREGAEAMVTEGGSTLFAQASAPRVWSSTETPVF